jgi:hypothetical protein
MRRHHTAWLASLAWTILALAPSLAHAQPELSFDSTGVLVSGVTAGETVLILGTGRERHGLVGHQFHLSDRVVDDDKDGAVRWERGEPIPVRSTWVAIDLANGAWDLEAPGPADLGLVQPPDVVELLSDRVTFAWSAVDFWHVRPNPVSAKAGVWGQSLLEGMGRDGDQVANGYLVVRLVELPLMDPGGQPPPGTLEPGDVVVGIHPQSFNWIVRTVS